MTINEQQLLTEGRLEDVKSAYGEQLGQIIGANPEEVIDLLSENDPSGNNKYLAWMTKQVISYLGDKIQDSSGSDILGMVADSGNKRHIKTGVKLVLRAALLFDKVNQKLKDKDINNYDLKGAFEAYINVSQKETVKKSEIEDIASSVEVIHEDERFKVYFPKNYREMHVLGKDTNWCVAQGPDSGGPTHWGSYSHGRCTFSVVFDKQADPNDNERKFTVPVSKDGSGIYEAEIQNVNQNPKLSITWLEKKIGKDLIEFIRKEVSSRRDEVNTSGSLNSKIKSLFSQDSVPQLKTHYEAENREGFVSYLKNLNREILYTIMKEEGDHKNAESNIKEEYRNAIAALLETYDHVALAWDINTNSDSWNKLNFLNNCLLDVFPLSTISKSTCIKYMSLDTLKRVISEYGQKETRRILLVEEGSGALLKSTGEDISNDDKELLERLVLFGITDENYKVKRPRDIQYIQDLSVLHELYEANEKQDVLPFLRGGLLDYFLNSRATDYHFKDASMTDIGEASMSHITGSDIGKLLKNFTLNVNVGKINYTDEFKNFVVKCIELNDNLIKQIVDAGSEILLKRLLEERYISLENVVGKINKNDLVFELVHSYSKGASEDFQKYKDKIIYDINDETKTKSALFELNEFLDKYILIKKDDSLKAINWDRMEGSISWTFKGKLDDSGRDKLTNLGMKYGYYAKSNVLANVLFALVYDVNTGNDEIDLCAQKMQKALSLLNAFSLGDYKINSFLREKEKIGSELIANYYHEVDELETCGAEPWFDGRPDYLNKMEDKGIKSSDIADSVFAAYIRQEWMNNSIVLQACIDLQNKDVSKELDQLQESLYRQTIPKTLTESLEDMIEEALNESTQRFLTGTLIPTHKLSRILLEGRLEDVKEKYTKILIARNAPHENQWTNREQTQFNFVVDKLSENDPSGNNKYLDWMVNQIWEPVMTSIIMNAGHADEESLSSMINKDIKVCRLFHKHLDLFPDKNINSYSPEDILEKFFLLKRQKVAKGEEAQEIIRGIEIIHEDERFKVYFPKNYKEMRVLGHDTTWCVAQKPPSGPRLWGQYTKNDCVFSVVFDKESNKNDVERKFTVPVDRDLGKVFQREIQNVKQNETLTLNWLKKKIGQELISKIEEELSQRIEEVEVEFNNENESSDLDKVFDDAKRTLDSAKILLRIMADDDPNEIRGIKRHFAENLQTLKTCKKKILELMTYDQENLEESYDVYKGHISTLLEPLDNRLRPNVLNNVGDFAREFICDIVRLFGVKNVEDSYWFASILSDKQFLENLCKTNLAEVKSAFQAGNMEIRGGIRLHDVLLSLQVSTPDNPYKILKNQDFRCLIPLNILPGEIKLLLQDNPKNKVLPFLRTEVTLRNLAEVTIQAMMWQNLEYPAENAPTWEDWAYKVQQNGYRDVFEDLTRDVLRLAAQSGQSKLLDLVEGSRSFLKYCYENFEFNTNSKFNVLFLPYDLENPQRLLINDFDKINVGFASYDKFSKILEHKNWDTSVFVGEPQSFEDLQNPADGGVNNAWHHVKRGGWANLNFFNNTVVRALKGDVDFILEKYIELVEEDGNRHDGMWSRNFLSKIDVAERLPMHDFCRAVFEEYIYGVKIIEDEDTRNCINGFVYDLYIASFNENDVEWLEMRKKLELAWISLHPHTYDPDNVIGNSNWSYAREKFFDWCHNLTMRLRTISKLIRIEAGIHHTDRQLFDKAFEYFKANS